MQHRGAKLFLGVLIAFFAVFTFAFLSAEQASAANPTTMNFQGKVVNSDGTNVTNGTYSFVFSLYTASSGGSPIWTETDSLTVTNGVFQVDLGAVCPFFSANACNGSTPIDFGTSNSIYLGITFNSDPQGEMSPRVKMQSVPYAFNSDKVGGLSVSQLVQLSPSGAQTGNINVTGSGTFATGITVSGAAVSINGGASHFDTNINAGTSNGLINIGNSASGAMTLQSAAAVNITAGAASTLSTGANTLTITSSNFSISSAGVLTVLGSQSADITTVGAATAAPITIKPGTSSGASSNGPSLTISAGNGSGTTSVTGGALSLQAGNATGGSGTRNGGSVTIDAGTGATINGSVSVGTVNASGVTISRSGITTTISGLASVSEGLTVTGTTSINGSGTTNTTIGNSAGGTITIGASSGSDLALNDAQWSVSGSGNAAFAQVTSPTYTSSAGLTMNSGSNTLTFDSSDTVLSATGLATINLGAAPTINAASGNITLAGTATGVSAAILVLPTKTDSGDPTTTQTNGGIYYNSNTSKFRCYEGSTWKNCIGSGGAGGSLQDAYDGSTSPELLLDTTNNGITIRNAATDAITGNLLEIQNNAGSATFLGVSSSEVRLQDSGGNVAFLFDSVNSELRVYDNSASPTAYARIYYAGGEAVFAASSGTTRVGAGSGNITMSLTGASDVFTFSKALTLGSAYSASDFTVTRNLSAGNNAATGNVLKVEDLTAYTGGSSAPNLLYLNQSNTGATGNLILAQLGGGSNDKFKVNTAGTVTIAAGQSFTSAGALTVSAGSGALTLQSGGANTVAIKPGTDSATAVQIQKAAGTSMLAFDASGDKITVGVSDTTATLFVLDTKTDAEGGLAGVNGAMYYNSNLGKFRCYEASAWKNCISASTSKFIVKGAHESVNASTTLQDDDDLSFTMGAGETWIFEFRLLVANSSSAGPDWKAAIYASTASSCNVTQSGSEPAGAAFLQSSTTDCTTPAALINPTIVADADSYNVYIQGKITDNGSGGTVNLRWAQNTSTGVNLQVRAGSYVTAQKVGGN